MTPVSATYVAESPTTTRSARWLITAVRLGLLAAVRAGALAAQPSPCEPARWPAPEGRGPVVRLCGVVRDDRERPIPSAEVAASLTDAVVRTDSAGRFTLVVPVSARGVLLAARAIGHAPVYRTVASARDTAVRWEPVLRGVQQLVRRTIEARGLTTAIAAQRYDELLARHAKGRGQFLIGDELWQTADLAAALGRVPGLEVYGGRAGTIQRIGALRCNRGIEQQFATGRIGVFVNGTDQTSRFALGGGREASPGDQRDMSDDANRQRVAAPMTQFVTAEEVLSEFRVGELAAIEVYRGRGEIPGVFANPDYCAVISVWTR